MNKRQIISVVLLGLGLSMLLYGYSLHVQPVYTKDNGKGLATTEAQLVLEVSRGGLKRKNDGKLHLTYSGTPPKACPT